ncbi:hypothetical protein [Cryptosporangium sp. NPDC048952]|uniref:hypothetical protein n=1 Tax=Cryptosporangium sp. NPDC048952 TaxID=3363961 RepID=UPI0037227495
MITRGNLLAVAVLLVGGLLAGCGDDSEPASEAKAPTTAASSAAPAEAPEGRLLTAELAKAALPTVDEVPGEGWVASEVPPPNASTVEPASCSPVYTEVQPDNPIYKDKVAGNAAVSFGSESPAGFSQVVVDVRSFTNAADSLLPINAGSLVDKCPSFTVIEDGEKIDTAVKKLTPIAVGDKQLAIQFSAEIQGTPAFITVVQASIGHNLVTIAHSSTIAGDPVKSYEPLVNGILKDLAAA